MKVLLVPNPPITHEKVGKTVVKLGDLLREHPRCHRLMQAITTLEKDAHVCDLSKLIQIIHNTIFGGKSTPNTLEDDYVG